MERPETMEVGANVIAGTEPEKIMECVRGMMERSKEWENPFGDKRVGGEDQACYDDGY